MCGACETDHRRGWASTSTLVLAFVVALLVFTILGFAIRATGSSGAVSACDAAASAGLRFQSAVTLDKDKPALLRSDTAAFIGELRSAGGDECASTRRFLASAEQTIEGLCPICAADLRVRATSQPDRA